ncbi:MAG: hypothetical protein CM15mP8_1360 [Methanobacteriota archaeon]|nr:MAG: hypothetical protein CM15mP8_1360 [Euryarchaeota archaeon]
MHLRPTDSHTTTKGKITKQGNIINWSSSRNDGDLDLIGTTEIYGTPQNAEPGSLEEFLFERYCLYTNKNGNIIAVIHTTKMGFPASKSKHYLKFTY